MINSNTAKMADARAQHLGDPLAAACAKDASTDLKRQGMLCAYQMWHFKEVCCEDQIYALPAAALEQLQDLSHVSGAVSLIELPGLGPGASSSGFQNDPIMDETSTGPRSRSRVVCFRLVNMKPKAQKSVSLLASLRSDHVAVRLYDVRDVHPESRTISIVLQLEESASADQVMLISLFLFLHMGSEAMATSMQECDVQPEVSYFFQGLRLSTLALGPQGCMVVTRLVNAGAYPDVGGTFCWVAKERDDEMPLDIAFEAVISELGEKKLVKCLTECRYQIIQFGFYHVRKVQTQQNKQSAFYCFCFGSQVPTTASSLRAPCCSAATFTDDLGAVVQVARWGPAHHSF